MRRAYLVGSLLVALLFPSPALAQKKVTCPDGNHYLIDVRQIAIKYEATRVESTVNGLAVLGVRVTVDQKTLQTAAVATQKMNEFIKGLAVGYNTCAITREQYQQAVNSLIPVMKKGAGQLEAFRKQILDGKKIQDKRLNQAIASIEDALRKFAVISGKQLQYDQIVTIVEEQSVKLAGLEEKMEKLEQQASLPPYIMNRLDVLERRNAELPVAKPAEVATQLKQALLAEADQAEAAYKKGYDLLERYRFAEAIPYLEQALQAVKLPDFYTALGRAYLESQVLGKGEQVAREGIEYAVQREDAQFEANMSSLLGMILQDKGDLDGALTYAKRALAIDEKVHGPDHATVATDVNSIGLILKDKRDLDGALKYIQRALTIDEKVHGPDHRNVVRDLGNIGVILQDKGDLDGALKYAQRALTISEKVYGPDHPLVAPLSNNIGLILREQRDLDGALKYAQRALTISEKVYGPDYPMVGIPLNSIGLILKDKGDFDGALKYIQRALTISEKVYGPDHRNVARDLNNIGLILLDKGDFDGALKHAKRALAIDEKVYGPDHPMVAPLLNDIGAILYAKGDLDGALKYTQRAVTILSKIYGPSHPSTVKAQENLDLVRKAVKTK